MGDFLNTTSHFEEDVLALMSVNGFHLVKLLIVLVSSGDAIGSEPKESAKARLVEEGIEMLKKVGMTRDDETPSLVFPLCLGSGLMGLAE